MASLAAAETADTIFINGQIYTVDESYPWVEALAVSDGKLVLVGSNKAALQLAGSDTEVVDLGGAFMMPGIQENHVHASSAGATILPYANRATFPPESTPEEIRQTLLDYAEASPGDGWIWGQQWDPSFFEDGRARKDFLDDIFPDRPVYLVDSSAHNAVVNSKALELAGITSDTPQPETGVIEMDSNSGEPTGFLAEMGLFPVGSIQTHPDVLLWKKAILESQEILHGFGITAITDAAVSREAIMAWAELAEEDKVRLRVDTALIMNDYFGEEARAQETLTLLPDLQSRLIDPFTVKWGADGTPLTKTSKMLEPYEGTNEYGILTISENMMNQMRENMRDGYKMMAHSIGDGTTKLVLDMIEEGRESYLAFDAVAQIAHPLWVTPEDMDRMARLNVVADMSPPVYFRFPTGDLYDPLLGPDRAAARAQIAEMLRRGVTVSYGSDWPASAPSANPFRNMEAMITRENPDDPDYPGGPLGEGVGLEDVIRIFTINGAYSMEHDDITGSIEVGKFADLVVLDQNPFELVEAGRTRNIGKISAVMTVFEGEIVFDAR
ncbi:amidohydrolase [Ruegeria sp. Ofav3-42]|uniref:amidohydrolase n=1 Tax=Ruegeria sp. Ofav3-42 TaxID=2917759 RepID=UPI001EF4F279|nr:amidohydrolase [Ruegeria sp. Ofav3-42]MCG7521166.1 amidohydrolase [Ruegeria sp. Ofav3-42]